MKDWLSGVIYMKADELLGVAFDSWSSTQRGDGFYLRECQDMVQTSYRFSVRL